jgi:hypothetical protein
MQAQIRLRHVERMKKHQSQLQEQLKREREAQARRAIEDKKRHARDEAKRVIIRQFGMEPRDDSDSDSDPRDGSDAVNGNENLSLSAEKARGNHTKRGAQAPKTLLPAAKGVSTTAGVAVKSAPRRTGDANKGKSAAERPVYYHDDQDLLSAYKDRDEVPSYVFLPVSLCVPSLFVCACVRACHVGMYLPVSLCMYICIRESVCVRICIAITRC